MLQTLHGFTSKNPHMYPFEMINFLKYLVKKTTKQSNKDVKKRKKDK